MIRNATAADEAAIRQLLVAAGLPIDDLQGRALEHFLVLTEEGRVIGAVGLDRVGDVALLRSLVVSDAARGRGLGKALVEAAEARARELRVRSLYLLTTTAGDFFAHLGYQATRRDAAPPAVASMPQFAHLCPSSSAFMSRAL